MPASIHEHPEEWLATALADGLSPDERRALDEHLAGCERCRELQAEFAALDETLLRDFPLAVGPDGGFETRLVAGFRRRRGDGGRLAKLRALLAWMLRQRGVRFAGMAATLVALVWLGHTLTGGGSHASFIANDARIIDSAIDQSAIENNMDASKPADLKQFRFAQVPKVPSGPAADADLENSASAPAVTATNRQLFNANVINQPVFSTKRGESTTADFDGFINYGSPIQTVRTDASGLLTGQNTFTGTTNVTAGQRPLSSATVSGTVNVNELPRLVMLDGRRLSETSPADRVVIAGGNIPSSEEVGIAPTPAPAARTPAATPAPERIVAAGGTVAEGDAVPVAPNAPAATPAPPDVRKLIRNARAELEVASFDAAVDAVTANAARDGGFLDTRNSARGGNGKIQGTLVVKVLPENLDRFLAGLRALGDVRNQTIQTEDVTKDYFDTDARLRNSRRMEERLLKMLDEVKGKMSEVLQVEKELARVRADIETMQGQLKVYDAQVRYATVTLDVRERDLNQPAAFLLRETATLSLLAADVEKTAAEVRRIADAAHAQTARSELTRDPAGKSRATLRLLIAPETAADVIAQIKTLGRVENFHVQDERTAQNGAPSDEGAQDPARVERAPVALDLTISHDEQISRQVTFTLVAVDVEGAFEKARTAAVAAGGEVVEFSLTHPSAGHANAVLGVRVPASAAAALLASFQSLGRAGEAETRRVGTGTETDAGPVLIRLGVVDAEPAVQQTTVRVQTTEVERRAADLKRDAAASRAVVEESNFVSESDGRQRAGLRFRLPMGAYADFVARVRALGTVKDFTVQRSDLPARPGGGAVESNAPVVVDLLLYSEGRIVGEESGLSSTLRRTFGQGAGALMWSVQMIGVALAFIAPWAALAASVLGVARWRRRSKKADMPLAKAAKDAKEEGRK